MSTLPFVGQFVTKWIASIGVEQLHQRTSISADRLCIGANSIAAFGSALCLVGVAFADCSARVLAVVCLIGSIAFTGFFSPGSMTSTV
jgi:hypothetical protein